MTEQEKRRDILGDLLRGPQGGAIRGIDELTKLIHRTASEPDPLARPRKASPPPAKRAKPSRRKKATHYLAEDVYDNLGEAKQMIKDLLPDGIKGHATKSKIVDTAVRAILSEFEEKGKDSFLVRQILEQDPEEK